MKTEANFTKKKFNIIIYKVNTAKIKNKTQKIKIPRKQNI